MRKYIVIPGHLAHSWFGICEYAYEKYGVTGNDFIGSRQYNAPSGKVVFKLHVD